MRDIDQLMLRGCLPQVRLVHVKGQNGGCRDQFRAQARSASHEQGDKQRHGTPLPGDGYSRRRCRKTS